MTLSSKAVRLVCGAFDEPGEANDNPQQLRGCLAISIRSITFLHTSTCKCVATQVIVIITARNVSYMNYIVNQTEAAARQTND